MKNKWIWLGVGIFFVIFYAMFTGHKESRQERKEIMDYIQSRGKTDTPKVWRNKIGEGI